MGKKKTHEEYIKQILEITSSIDVVGIYINSNTRLTHKCKICGHMWDSLPSNILKGSGCPKCANLKKSIDRSFTVDEYIDKLSVVNHNIEFVGDYKNANTKAMHYCKVCGYKWMAYPGNILSGKGCKKCSDKSSADARRKTHYDYVIQVNSINTSVAVLGEYVNAKTPIRHKCIICEHEWDALPDNILHGHGCPKCIESSGEKTIEEYLIAHSILFDPQHSFLDCRNKKPLPFDFYIPSLNVCIEYDGIQHFKPIEYFGGVEAFEQRKRNDAIKNNYCLTNNINLLRIKYDQCINDELDNLFNNTKLIEEAV